MSNETKTSISFTAGELVDAKVAVATYAEALAGNWDDARAADSPEADYFRKRYESVNRLERKLGTAQTRLANKASA